MRQERPPAPDGERREPEWRDDFRGLDEDAAREALVWLRRRHGACLRALALCWCGRDVEWTEEALQELNLRLWDRRKRFDPVRSGWLSWTKAILHHLIVDEHRRRARRTGPAAPGAEPPVGDPMDLLPGREPAPDRSLLLQALQQDVQDCLQRLPPADREALKLQVLDGLTLEEIGTHTGVPSRTVGTRCHRARARLRACLKQKDYERGGL